MKEIFWDTLGIPPTTDTKKIRKAYSELVKKHNPEDDEEAFRKINQAYRAAMNFARQISALNINDEQMVITNRREDGSFQIHVKKENELPGAPSPVMTSEEEENPAKEPSLFDFGDIDSSRVKGLTVQEIDEMTGYLSLAPGFPVPDSEKTRRIKKFIDDNDLIKRLSNLVKPEETEEAISNMLEVAKLILDDEDLMGERVLWQFYFFSPRVGSLAKSLEFYSKLEKLTDDARLSVADAYAIAEVCPLHPRVNVNVIKPNLTEGRIDFRTNVTFIYKENKYPAFDELMKDENPEDVKELIEFLQKIRLNLHAMLMPVVHPVKKYALLDALTIFNFILRSPECEKIRQKPILWKLYFQGALIKPMISDHDLHVGLTKAMLDMDLSKDLVKIMKKQIGKETCFIRQKMGNNNSYFITFRDSEIRKDKNGKYVYIPYGQVTPWVQNFVSIAVFVLVLIMAILMGMTLMQKN